MNNVNKNGRDNNKLFSNYLRYLVLAGLICMNNRLNKWQTMKHQLVRRPFSVVGATADTKN